MKNYFQTLGLNESASEEDIKRAYKRMAMQHHPDRGGDVSQFQEIQEAYDTLSDPQRRAQWEQQRNFGHQHGPFGFSFNFGPDINDIIRQFHGDSFGHFRQVQRNRDLRVVMDLDLASTLNAQVKHVDIRGSDGSLRTVKIDIPKGIQGGMQMRCPGHGENHIKNVPPGDLIVEFRITQTHGFEIDRINLHTKLSLNCIDAILGTNQTITGLDGKQFSLTLPAGTQPNTQFRIPGQGLWDVNQPVRGDLIVEVIITIPTSINQKQIQELAKHVN